MNKPNSIIQFHFQAICSLPKRSVLKAFIIAVFKKEKQPLHSVSIIFCNDPYLLSLNRQFLNHDFYTDILSFPLSPKGDPLTGEIYISVDRIRENAKTLEIPVTKELHRVIFHGILHFCGYKDKSQKEIKEMRAKEELLLKAYFGAVANLPG